MLVIKDNNFLKIYMNKLNNVEFQKIKIFNQPF